MKKFSLLPAEQLNKGYTISALGLLAYMIACGTIGHKLAGIIALINMVVSVYVLFSVSAVRSEEKEKVGYNLLWGSAAIAIMMIVFSIASVKLWLGL